MSEQVLGGGNGAELPPVSREVRDYESVIGPAVDDLRAAVALVRRTPAVDLPYEGYNIGLPERAGCPGPKEYFTAENLAYSEEEQGHDAAEEIMANAVRLGMEQGRRQAWGRLLGKCESEDVDLFSAVNIEPELAKRYTDYFAGEQQDIREDAYRPWPSISQAVPLVELVTPIRIALDAAYELDDVSKETSRAIDEAIERAVTAGITQGGALWYQREVSDNFMPLIKYAKFELEAKAADQDSAVSVGQLADIEKVEAILSSV